MGKYSKLFELIHKGVNASDVAKKLGFFSGANKSREEIFRCPNPNHADIHPSAKYDNKNNKIKCFSCGYSADAIDLVRIAKGLNNIEALKELVNEYYPAYMIEFEDCKYDDDFKRGIRQAVKQTIKSEINNVNISNKKDIEEPELTNKEKVDRYMSFSGVYSLSYIDDLMAYKYNKSAGAPDWFKEKDFELAEKMKYNGAKDYIRNRCIPYSEMMNILNINNITPIFNGYYNKIAGKYANYVGFKFSDDFIMKRCINKDIKYDNNGNPDLTLKENVGYPHPVMIYNGHKKECNYKNLYICEGIFDALSIICNTNKGQDVAVLCLNSVTNVTKFGDFIWEVMKFENVYDCLDMDDAGRKCSNSINIILSNAKINAMIPFAPLFNSGLHDVNEWWIDYCKKHKLKFYNK